MLTTLHQYRTVLDVQRIKFKIHITRHRGVENHGVGERVVRKNYKIRQLPVEPFDPGELGVDQVRVRDPDLRQNRAGQ